ncbi:MAG: hypothetical protein GX801_02945, partial [Fibrobacter sp.]|nr:hypothetical protein [Fibrobacter sp.]
MKSKIIFGIAFTAMLFLACTVSLDTVPDVKVQGNQDKETKAYLYRGGLMKMWIKLHEPVDDINQIRWKTGKADIAKRQSLIENNQVLADTVYLHWESLPTAAEWEADSSTVSGDSLTNSDSLMASEKLRYFDTIAVVVDGMESKVEVVEIINILPRIDSLFLRGIAQRGDSQLVVSVHPGERVDLAMSFVDAFNEDFPVQTIDWPDLMGEISLVNKDDSIWRWRWEVPNELLDTALTMVLTDKSGFGTRKYELKLIVYEESGSVWAVAGPDLLKFSSQGSEVLRVKSVFKEASDMVVNTNSTIINKVYVLDAAANKVFNFDSYGRLIKLDSTSFVAPMALALDAELGFLWVSDLSKVAGDTLYSRIRKFDFNSQEEAEEIGQAIDIPGPVKSLSADQFHRDMLWFTSAKEDMVGYINFSSGEYHKIDGGDLQFNRPLTVSYDPVSGLAWVADSSRVIAIDREGKIKATITDFEYANALSAGGGVCWVSDVYAGAVYKFSSSILG